MFTLGTGRWRTEQPVIVVLFSLTTWHGTRTWIVIWSPLACVLPNAVCWKTTHATDHHATCMPRHAGCVVVGGMDLTEMFRDTEKYFLTKPTDSGNFETVTTLKFLPPPLKVMGGYVFASVSYVCEQLPGSNSRSVGEVCALLSPSSFTF